MFYLLEATYTNNKESAALYPVEGAEPFANETELTAEFDTKMGAAVKADAFKAELLVAFDSTGKVYAQGYHSKDESVSLSPRLVWVTTDNNGETANQSKANSMTVLEGDFYSKRGAAKKNADVKAIMLMGITGKAISYNCTDYWARPIEPVEPQPEPVEPTE